MVGTNKKQSLLRVKSRPTDLIVAFQPTRGLDVGAVEYIHRQLIGLRDEGKAILVSLLN